MLRFDFSAKKPLSDDEIHTINTYINNCIAQVLPVDIQEMSLDDAKQT
jgi:alanyl-tRNA synthetase